MRRAGGGGPAVGGAQVLMGARGDVSVDVLGQGLAVYKDQLMDRLRTDNIERRTWLAVLCTRDQV